MFKLLNVVIFSLLLSGCSVVDMLIYKVSKQQGNITEQKHVDKLEIGMTKEQVKFLIGTPMSVHSFDHDRWDYIYTFQAANLEPTRNNLTVYFENNKLTKIEGEALVKKGKLTKESS
ncbi:MAG: outer membrane assembly protein BamE [Gammaproteobacteria bacterium]|nr:MAG: outer membrane assembly protein BamE [Gammaproteobacteria bacterium]